MRPESGATASRLPNPVALPPRHQPAVEAPPPQVNATFDGDAGVMVPAPGAGFPGSDAGSWKAPLRREVPDLSGPEKKAGGDSGPMPEVLALPLQGAGLAAAPRAPVPLGTTQPVLPSIEAAEMPLAGQGDGFRPGPGVRLGRFEPAPVGLSGDAAPRLVLGAAMTTQPPPPARLLGEGMAKAQARAVVSAASGPQMAIVLRRGNDAPERLPSWARSVALSGSALAQAPGEVEILPLIDPDSDRGALSGDWPGRLPGCATWGR